MKRQGLSSDEERAVAELADRLRSFAHDKARFNDAYRRAEKMTIEGVEMNWALVHTAACRARARYRRDRG